VESIRHSSYLSGAVLRLAARDVERLLGFVADAEELGSEEPFTPELLDELGKLVAADAVSYCEQDRVRKRVRLSVDRPSDSRSLPDVSYWDIAHEHPVCRVHSGGVFSAFKLSDFVSLGRLRRSKIYALWFRPMDVQHELNVALPSPPWHTKTFLFDRGPGSPDFSERDRLVLDLLQPHLTRLWKRAHAPHPEPARLGLTARELQVLAWVARGKTNPEIAQMLWITPATVRKHLENIYAKLGVRTRTAAAAQLLATLDDSGMR
jgi:DNA-binding CsgD family transcriptional regulator